MIPGAMNEENMGWNRQNVLKLQHQVVESNRLLVKTFGKHCNAGLFALKSHLLNHVVENLRVFRTLFVFDALPLAQYNVNTNHAYKQTSKRSNTYMSETMARVEP